jgi:hypothetical protein
MPWNPVDQGLTTALDSILVVVREVKNTSRLNLWMKTNDLYVQCWNLQQKLVMRGSIISDVFRRSMRILVIDLFIRPMRFAV